MSVIKQDANDQRCSKDTIAALRHARELLIEENHKDAIPIRWDSPVYRLLTALEAGMAKYFDEVDALTKAAAGE